MGTKRGHYEELNGNKLEPLDDSVLEEPVSKKQKDDNGVTTDRIDIWLVKKPKNISVKDLAPLQLPKKIKSSNRERTFETKAGVLSCTFERSSGSMFYFKAPAIVYNVKEQSNLPILQSVKNFASIKLQADVEDPFPNALEEDIDLIESGIEPELPPFQFKIKSIRRKPKLAEGPRDRTVGTLTKSGIKVKRHHQPEVA